MGSRNNGGCCDKSSEGNHVTNYKSIWVKSPDGGNYGGEPNYLSAYHYNQLLAEMVANKANINTKMKNFPYDYSIPSYYHSQLNANTGTLQIGRDVLHIKKIIRYSNANIPGFVDSGTVYSAAAWNNTCDQIKILINEAKHLIEATGSNVNLSVNAAEVDSYKYSSGEVVKASKSITHLINLVRRARIHCYCHAERFVPCNHCSAHLCRRDSCCDKSSCTRD